MIKYSNECLEEYHHEVNKGSIIAGTEMKLELNRLINDFDNDRYIYDTDAADMRIDFMEHCVKLTKSPFYGMPMKLLL